MLPQHRQCNSGARPAPVGLPLGMRDTKPELEVGMAKSGVEGAGLGCCSTIPLRPRRWGDTGGSLAVQWPCSGHLVAVQWSRSGHTAVV